MSWCGRFAILKTSLLCAERALGKLSSQASHHIVLRWQSSYPLCMHLHPCRKLALPSLVHGYRQIHGKQVLFTHEAAERPVSDSENLSNDAGETTAAVSEESHSRTEKLEYLIRQGCLHHQLIEAEQVLLVDHQHLEKACALLRENKLPISMKTVELMALPLSDGKQGKVKLGKINDQSSEPVFYDDSQKLDTENPSPGLPVVSLSRNLIRMCVGMQLQRSVAKTPGPTFTSVTMDPISRGLLAVQRYLKKLNGVISVVDYMSSMFEIPIPEVENLLQRYRYMLKINVNPHSARWKLNVLLDAGITMEQVLQDPWILLTTSVGLSLLKRRIEKVKRLDLPLSVKLLGRTNKKAFESSIWVQCRLKMRRESRWLEYAEMFEQPVNSLMKIDFLHTYNVENIRPKVEYLQSKHWSVTEILANIKVTKFTYRRIVEGHEKLENNLLDGFNLHALHDYLSHGTVRRQQVAGRESYRYIVSLLGFAKRNDPVVKSISKGVCSILFDQNVNTIKENFTFLSTIGFSVEHLRELPIILGHNPAILKRHWTELTESDRMRPMDRWWETPVRLLNMLQYRIETSDNFRYPIVK